MPMGLAARSRPGGCRRRLLPFFRPRGVPAAPGGLGVLDGGLGPGAASALSGPSEPPLPLAPPPGQGLSLSTSLRSHTPHLWPLRARGWGWAMLPLRPLCGHEDTGRQGSEAQHQKAPLALETRKAAYVPREPMARDWALSGIRVREAGSPGPNPRPFAPCGQGRARWVKRCPQQQGVPAHGGCKEL